MTFWQRHWKKIVGAIVAIPLLVLAGSWIYVEFIKDEPPAALDEDDLADRLAASTTVAGVDPPAADTSAASTASTTSGSTTAGTAAPTTEASSAPASSTPASSTPAGGGSASTVDGNWNITAESELRYRVRESINGFDTEGVGSTNQVTGVLTLAGSTATAADFTVDMTTFTSDEDRRDGQFNGRIMAVDQFPTSEFHLTAPIDFGSVPAEGESITASATGDLTLRGVTNSVTFELTARLQNGRIGVLGAIPVVFADYGIPNPSFATITTEDNGLLEFVLVFERA